MPTPPHPAAEQRPSRIYALGPEGTFSDQAARRLRGAMGRGPQGDGTVPIAYTRTIPEVLSAAENEPGSWGVIPIENSVAGIVGQAQDSLINHRVTIFREINVPVRFSLLASKPLAQVGTYYAHPQAFDQCSEYLAAHLAQGEVLFVRSNVEAGRTFLDHAEGEAVAAIVPIDFGSEHSAWRAAEDIQTYQNNTTRFLAVRCADPDEVADFGRQKTSVCIEPQEDRPGVLYEILSIFQRHKVNLCRLESRPAKVRPWAYVFFVDFTNGENSAACLADLRATTNTITLLGSYDALE